MSRPIRAVKLDYHVLNDGSDEEANVEDRIELSLIDQLQPVSCFDSQSIEYAI